TKAYEREHERQPDRHETAEECVAAVLINGPAGSVVGRIHSDTVTVVTVERRTTRPSSDSGPAFEDTRPLFEALAVVRAVLRDALLDFVETQVVAAALLLVPVRL